MKEPDTNSDPLIGTIVGDHFELLSSLGSGGMSVVYKAKDLLLNRIVAVKLLRGRSSLVQKNVMRFRQEAMAALKMDHANIIRVYEFDIPDRGEPYLVMDYLQGESLAELIANNGPIELKSAVSIMRGVCAGLEHAHQAGVLHRDLKPANIMLVKDEGGQKAKLFDFGIAKLLFDEDGGSSALTQTGDFVGSPLYMSPEQCACDVLDARSDVYALGCVMYEMVTGKPPFVGNNLLETMQMQTSSVARPVKEIYPAIKNADAVESVLLKAMAKQRAQRFQTVTEFSDAIQTLSEDSRKGIFDQAKFQLEFLKNKSSARKREPLSKLSLILSGVTVLATIAVLTLWLRLPTHQLQKPERQFSLKDLPTADQQQPELAWSKVDLLAQEAVDDGDYDKAQPLYDLSYKIAKSIGPQYQLASIEGMSDLSTLTGKDAKTFQATIDRLAHQSMNSQLLINAMISATDKNEVSALIDKSDHLATFLNNSGRYSESQELLKTALAVGKRYLPADDPTNARCLLSLAEAYNIEGMDQRISPELEYRMKAYDIAKHNPHDLLFENCVFSIGRYYNHEEKAERAAFFLNLALKTATQLHGDKSKQVAKCYAELAMSYLDLKQQTLSDASAQQALNILQHLKAHELDEDSFFLLGRLEAGLGRKNEALSYFTRSLNAFESGPAKDYPDLANCCRWLVEVLPPVSRKREALLKRRITILKRLGDLSPAEECHLYKMLSDGYYLNGNLIKEREVQRRAVEIISKWPPHSPNRREQIDSALFLAQLDVKQGDLKEAEKNAKLFKSWVMQEYGPHTLMNAHADGLLGSIYVDTDRLKEGRALMQNALHFYQSYKPSTDKGRAYYKESKDNLITKFSELDRRQRQAEVK